MEKEIAQIIPTQNIAFAVLDDGTTINNFVGKDGNPKPENILKLFSGIEELIKTADDRIFNMFALTYIICESRIHFALMERVDKEKDNINK